MHSNSTGSRQVPKVGIEPTRLLRTLDFESSASADSATLACAEQLPSNLGILVYRRIPQLDKSNRRFSPKFSDLLIGSKPHPSSYQLFKNVKVKSKRNFLEIELTAPRQYATLAFDPPFSDSQVIFDVSSSGASAGPIFARQVAPLRPEFARYRPCRVGLCEANNNFASQLVSGTAMMNQNNGPAMVLSPPFEAQ